MLAALLDKMFGTPGTAPSTDPGPAPAAQEPPAPLPGAPMTQNDLKGIPSDAFFFGWAPEQYQIYLLGAHPDGSGCGAGCGATPGTREIPMSNSCVGAYSEGSTSCTLELKMPRPNFNAKKEAP